MRDPAAKILSRAELVGRYGRPRTERVVFTNGCFDLLHPGHVTYLTRARALGDALVVGLNTDASVRRLEKAPDRPLVPQASRALVLAALESVDAVTLFDEDTPAAKGGDYRLDQVVGRDVVEAAGGRVELIPFVEGHSTTELVHRIRELDRG
jgi:D-beta-D-heptose 7-phosphate kinase/D-beta-D-heptose 1-phosphate adenosyltransferase